MFSTSYHLTFVILRSMNGSFEQDFVQIHCLSLLTDLVSKCMLFVARGFMIMRPQLL